MPSWDAHEECANILGFDAEICRKADRDIDRVFHDIGRRMPEDEATLYERFFDIPSWLKKVERSQKVMLHFSMRLQNPEYNRCFVLHHALDVFSNLLIAENLTNYRKNTEYHLLFMKAYLKQIKLIDRRLIDSIVASVVDKCLNSTVLQNWYHRISEEKRNERLSRFNECIKGRLPIECKESDYPAPRWRPGLPKKFADDLAKALATSWKQGIEIKEVVQIVLDKNCIKEWVVLSRDNELRNSRINLPAHISNACSEIYKTARKSFENLRFSEDRLKHNILKFFRIFSIPDDVSTNFAEDLIAIAKALPM